MTTTHRSMTTPNGGSDLPLIDREAPAKTERFTFALG